MSREGIQVPRELVSFSPTDTELMAGLILGVNGPIPIDETSLSKGLVAAVLQADFLQRFVDEAGKNTPAANEAISDLERQGFLIREDGNWIVPVSKLSDGVNTAAGQINAKVRSIFKQPGIDVLTSAGQAAFKIWWPEAA